MANSIGQTALTPARPGKLLVLAQEAVEAKERAALLRDAADLLQKTGQVEFALAQVDSALAIDPNDLSARRQKALLLAEASKFAAAREWAEKSSTIIPKTRQAGLCWDKSRKQSGSRAGARTE